MRRPGPSCEPVRRLCAIVSSGPNPVCPLTHLLEPLLAAHVVRRRCGSVITTLTAIMGA